MWDALGDGLLTVGDTAGATAQFRHALAVAARTGQPVGKETRKKLNAFVRAGARGAR